MTTSFYGDILYLDLSSGTVRSEPFTREMAESTIGSRGYGAELLWRMVPKGADPLGPTNALIFGVGLLTGTSVPSSGRTSITTKSPATGLYLKSNVGGAWGAALRFAGYSFLVVTGQSDHPVYLWIDNNRVEIRDAHFLWGKDVRETEKLIHRELSDSNIRIAAIGPAGENLVMYASIMCSNYNAAARGGIGAVMGSKRLKAIAVRGNRPVEVPNPKRFGELIKESWDLYHAQSGVLGTHLFGTAGGVLTGNATGTFSAYNHQKSSFEDASKLSGQYLASSGLLIRRVGCYACPMSCHRYSEVHSGPYKGTYTGGPEFETVGSLGAANGSGNIEGILKANEYCNIYGLDTISTGRVIAWIFECHQRELDFDRDGLDMEWGNTDTIIELCRRIALREGIGNILAEGTKRAAKIIGQGSDAWAMQAKGLEQAHCDSRSSMAYSLAYAVNPRGPDHLMTEALAERGRSPEMLSVIEEITGDKKYANQYMTEKRAEIVRWHEDVYAVTDGLGLCAFASTAQYYMTPKLMAELFSTMIGREIEPKEILLLGKKIVTMEKAFNVREGADRKYDSIPKRLMVEEPSDRVGKNAIVSQQLLDTMLDEYYLLHGWDVASGLPTRKVYETLGLGEWADELENLSLLPVER